MSVATLRADALVDGDSRDAASGERFSTENPATGTPLADIAACGPDDIDAAVIAVGLLCRGRAVVGPLDRLLAKLDY